MKSYISAFVVLFASAIWVSPSSAEDSDGQCVDVDPVATSKAISPYDDQSAFEQSTKPVRSFLRIVTQSADDPTDTSAWNCARKSMSRWAKMRALLSPPASFEGYRELIRYSFAINVAIGKFRQAHRNIDEEIMEWAHSMTTITVDYFGHRESDKWPPDNLYVWSGAAAAAYLLLEQDDHLRSYQNAVWQKALSVIGSDGRVPQELRRNEHALGYHAYFLSALLWLEKMRLSLGYHLSSKVISRIGLVDQQILDVTCSLSRVIQGQPMKQNIPTSTMAGSLEILDYGLWNKIRKCGVQNAPNEQILLGGNITKTLEYINRVGN